MTDGESRARQRFAQAPVARMATVSDEVLPHLVPVVFAVDGDTVYTAVDGKPKSGAPLRRLGNIAANPNVSLLVDHYDDDWNALWWVRVDGTAQVHHAGVTADRAYALLRAKYAQYETVSLDGPVIAVTVRRRRWWHGRSSP
ncbi:TIGR03668 family PPOX class F420-dependent oxidoreductase [Williamsia phyllosphaerae]|uniref:PPOX class F420-dependent oxidoreductase n=1 Tax=Williamsia phyllosphaerae TaxID=885042 RepID=A0ABQ1V178_9NOCA|nr:TIGR03668 family PPOX class F420-dependent oxidoreductase [Williamsia phyllosphaerae]GGF33409.1 PPOX class F420-dependent oxidoreductase [Williamsia phyllosphaerae]